MGGSNSKNDLNTKSKVAVKKFITLGLPGVGKSSLIYRLKHGEPPKDYLSTIGIDFQVLYQDGLKLQAWDHAGRGHYRVMAKMYTRGSSGIIYVIDSANASDLDESLDFLSSLLNDEDLNNLTVMVVANKQDLDDAVGPEVIEEKIKQNHKIKPGFTVFVMPMSVTAEDDHSMQLAFRLFVKTMKRKDVGKVESGLIQRAWETAEKEVEDSENDLEDEDDIDRQDDHETKVTDKDGNTKEKEEDGYLPFVADEKKKSIFKDPVHVFKSLLIH